MAKHWLFVFCAVAFVGVNADVLSDFSNNLATDIGPILVLFGESMTRQYLSESTSFLDYFIFAMAPIGILTAIVSTIRVCGHSSLRAFVGRSQEGDGAVEAELCTSTSRDVCELFNRGGITRVLGRPSIIELIYVPRSSGAGTEYPGVEKADLFLFRDYLETQADPDISDWIKEGPVWEKTNFRTNLHDSCAPHPNLSLNVGIVKPPKPVFFAIAIAGLILQAGVLALAGVGVWIFRWNLSEGRNSSLRDYAPVMFITGTVLMCGGMWSCAALIGQTTHELRFRRKRQPLPQRPRLLWLQPGPQVIGDQTFDPFVYFENTETNPLRVWTSSKKDFDERFEVYTFFAVLAVLIGYVMQFIGLRGMQAWVSLAQLGITVIMSILRGCLRMQRLGRDANKLARMPDMVSGHELDWLSFEISRQFQQKPYSYWHVTGQHEEAEGVERQSRDSENGPQPHEPSPEATHEVYPAVMPQADNTGQIGCDELLRIRVRLAHLTGHISFKNIDDSEYQKWKDGFIKVRTKAGQLSTAICLAAVDLSQKIPQNKGIRLRIQASASINGDQATQQLISVILKPPPEFSTGWSMDSAQLEAILGLWMWTLVSNERLGLRDESLPQIYVAEKAPRARIVSAGPDDKNWSDKANVQAEMDLWLGSSAVRFREGTLTLDKQSGHGLASLWRKAETGSRDDFLHWESQLKVTKSNANQPKLVPLPQRLYRFCGWNPVHSVLGSGASSSTDSAAAVKTSGQQADEQVKLRVQLAQPASTNISLLDLCSQELFTALMMSLAGLLTIDKVTISESAGIVRLRNKTVSTFADAFVESGLGSYSDALLCIIPALREQLPPPDPEDMLSALITSAAAGNEAVVQLLLGKGAKIESKDEEGRTALLWAARNGHEAVVKLLLKKNADIESKDRFQDWTPLSWAAARGHDTVVKLVLDKGADTEPKSSSGWMPLSWAAANGHETVVQLLLDKGADIGVER